jgi:hypothetical protein
VEWSLKDINKPLCVSTYQLEQVVARTVRELEQRKKMSEIGCTACCSFANEKTNNYQNFSVALQPPHRTPSGVPSL